MDLIDKKNHLHYWPIKVTRDVSDNQGYTLETRLPCSYKLLINAAFVSVGARHMNKISIMIIGTYGF